MTIAIGNARHPVVRYKTKWGDQWKTLQRGLYAIDSVTEGSAGGIGSATLETWTTAVPNREAGAPAIVELKRDTFVQIGAEDPTQTGSGRIRWLWIGVVAESSWVHQGTESGNGGSQSFIVHYTHRLEGLGSLLHRVIVQRCWIKTSSGQVKLDKALPFNVGIDGTVRGNRSAAKVNNRYIHDLSRVAPEKWTAAELLNSVMADHLVEQFPDWPPFGLGGQLECLEYVDAFDFAGRPLDEVLSTCAGLGRACTWTIEPTEEGTGTVTVRITSALEEEKSIDGTTLPASDRQVQALETGDSHFTVESSLIDRKRRWTLAGTVLNTMTVKFRPGSYTAADGLKRGWASADDSKTGSSDGKYAMVWRLFRLRSDWTGRADCPAGATAAEGVATTLTVDETGAYTGERTTTGGTCAADACALSGDLLYPAVASSDGTAGAPLALADWAEDSATKLPGDAPRDKIRVFVTTESTNSKWKEVTDQFQIQVVSDPAPGILIGANGDDAVTLRGLVGTSGQLLVTLTVIEPLPLLISYVPEESPGNDTRVTTGAQLHHVSHGTVVGITGDVLVRCDGGRDVRDDRPRLRALLAGVGPYLDRAGTAKIHNGLEILAADNDWRPSTLALALDDGRGESYRTALRSLITSRTWHFTPGAYGTTITLEPLSLDIRSYL